MPMAVYPLARGIKGNTIVSAQRIDAVPVSADIPILQRYMIQARWFGEAAVGRLIGKMASFP
jgi:hypothetical protein